MFDGHVTANNTDDFKRKVYYYLFYSYSCHLVSHFCPLLFDNIALTKVNPQMFVITSYYTGNLHAGGQS